MRAKKVCGVGINDVNGASKSYYYSIWYAMIFRCYSGRVPGYIRCTVCKDWHRFSKFREWMTEQDWQGKQLDKDIIIPGNKEYSPEACCFVSSRMNVLFTRAKPYGKGLPTGVKRKGSKFTSVIMVDGTLENLGTYNSAKAANDAYNRRRRSVIYEAAMDELNEDIREGMLRHCNAKQVKPTQKRITPKSTWVLPRVCGDY